MTKRAVDAAAPQATRYFVWDTELKGFAVRVATSGTKTYIVRYRPRGIGPGAPRRFDVLGRHGPLTPDEARARAKALLGAVAAGRDPAREQIRTAEGISVASLTDVFIEEHAKAKRKSGTADNYEAILKTYLGPRLGKRAADSITAGEIAQLHTALRDRPYQAKRLLAIVGSMYGFAAKRGLVARGTNPALGLERFRETSRERYLSSDELARLGEALRLAETVGLPWKSDPAKPPSKHLPAQELRRTWAGWRRPRLTRQRRRARSGSRRRSRRTAWAARRARGAPAVERHHAAGEQREGSGRGGRTSRG